MLLQYTLHKFFCLANSKCSHSLHATATFFLFYSGLTVYPCVVEKPSFAFALNHPVVIGILCGAVAVLALVVVAVVVACRRRLRREKEKRRLAEGKSSVASQSQTLIKCLAFLIEMICETPRMLSFFLGCREILSA